MTKALVVGYGSIGSRHTRILKELGCEVGVVSRRRIDFTPHYRSLLEGVEQVKPQYAVIANETADHYETLVELGKYGFKGVILVEKPLFSVRERMPPYQFKKVFIGYNLRFHPLLRRLKEFLQEERILSAQIDVGQYLPHWRPGRDHHLSYSASRKRGGGVLRDLSHEFDYVDWIFGRWQCLTALGGHFSHLEIESEDIFSILMKMSRCPLVSIHMNYLDRPTRREIRANTDRHTVQIDLIGGSLEIDGKSKSFPIDRDFTYRAQHQAILNGEEEALCSLEMGIEVLRTIEAVEKANQKKIWISR